MVDAGALKAAEVALSAAMAAVVAAEHEGATKASDASASTDAFALPPEPKSEASASTYLGHIGETAVEGKDY